MIRVGIIGAGFGTTGLLPAFTGIPGVRIVGHARSRVEWRALIARDDIDAVAIAVPPRAQYTIAKAAIERNLHVFAEKPLASSLKEARALCTLAKKKKIVHGIDLMFPDIAAWLKVHELLASKKYGKLLHVSSRWEWLSGDIRYGRDTWRTNPKEGGGALSFYFPHEIYALERFAGPIKTVRSVLSHSPLSKNGGEIGAGMLFVFESGVTGDAHLSCNTRGLVRHEFIFRCEHAVIEMKNQRAIVDGFTIDVHSDKGTTRIRAERDRDIRGEDERVKIVRKLARRFIAACAGKGEMYPTFADGLRAQEVVEHIKKARVRY